MSTRHLDAHMRAAAAAADDLRVAGDVAQRLRCLRDLVWLAAEHHRDLSELASAAWLADRLVEDVQAAGDAAERCQDDRDRLEVRHDAG